MSDKASVRFEWRNINDFNSLPRMNNLSKLLSFCLSPSVGLPRSSPAAEYLLRQVHYDVINICRRALMIKDFMEIIEQIRP